MPRFSALAVKPGAEVRLRHLVLALTLLVGACSSPDLPDVPGFETFGFEDALAAVRDQVREEYRVWLQDPLDAEQNGRLGMHLSVYRRSASAEILYRRARALAPEDFRWTYYLAFTLRDLGRREDATQMFREALTLRPGHVESRIALAQLLFAGGETDESRALFEAVADEFPDRVEGWLGLGKALTELGEHEPAVEALERAREVGPQYGEVYFALGQALRESGDRDRAARALASYERLRDNKIRAADELILAVGQLHAGDAPHMARGQYHLERAGYEEAEVAFRAALAVNPANQDAWIGLVRTHGRAGQVDAAGAVYREALDAGIVYALLHQTYGEALLDARRLDDARTALTRALELDPAASGAHAALGRVELLAGNGEASAERYRRAVALRPGDPHLAFSLGRALNAAGDFDQAAERLVPLLEEGALDTSLTLLELARARHGAGRDDEAIELLERAREEAWRLANVPAADTAERLLAEWR